MASLSPDPAGAHLRTAVFAESLSQLDALERALRSGKVVRERLLLLAVTPEVEFESNRRGLPSVPLEDHVPWRALCDLGDANNCQADSLCERLDELFADLGVGHPGLRHASHQAFFHPIKGVLDALTLRFYPVQAALSQPGIGEVLAFAMPEYAVGGPNLLDKPTLGLTSRLAPVVARALGLKVRWLRAANPPTFSPEGGVVLARPAPAAKTRAALCREMNALAEQWSRLAPPSAVETRPTLFSYDGLDDSNDPILRQWHALPEAQFAPLSELGAAPPGAGQVLDGLGALCRQLASTLWRRASRDGQVRALLRFDGVDLFALARPQLSLLVLVYLPYLLNDALLAQWNLRRYPRSVILLGGIVFRQMAWAKAGAEVGVPMVSIHKGGYLGYSLLPMHERYDMAEADYFVCNGEGAERVLGSSSPRACWRPGRKRARPVGLGAAWVERMVRARRPAPPRCGPRSVVYIMSAMLGDNTYLGHVFQPEIWLQRHQLRLAEFLRNFPDTRFLFKPPLADRYPQFASCLGRWVAEHQGGNVGMLEPNEPLGEILYKHDAFILDTPSTPLMDLVASSRPFFAYLDERFFLMQQEPLEVLRHRCPVAVREEEFLPMLGEFLALDDYSQASPVDDRFLALFGAREGQGGAAERTARFLRGLVRPG